MKGCTGSVLLLAFFFTSGSFEVSFAADNCAQQFANAAEKTISSKLDPQGNIILFRVIDGEYKRGFVGDYTKAQGGDSYSFDPYSVQQWGDYLAYDPAHVKDPHLHVLIVKENVNTDNLSYPSHSKILKLMNGAKELSRSISMGREQYEKVTAITPLSDFALLSEVKVPTGSEKIIGIIDYQTFSDELKKTTPDQFDLHSFLSNLKVTNPDH